MSSVIASSGVFIIQPSVAIATAFFRGCNLKADISANRSGIIFHIGVPQAGSVDVRVFNI